MSSAIGRASRELPVVEEEEPVPPLFALWLRDLLGGPVPREVNATCSQCAMCAPAEGTDTTRVPEGFNSETKCCTFDPEIKNFMLGAILADTSQGNTGRAVVERALEDRAGVTPLGLRPLASYQLLYNAASSRVFGRASKLLCRFYRADVPGGACGIWAHRNAVCTTWFCKHVRGRVGRQFWGDVKRLLDVIELELSVWCALQLGVTADALRSLLTPDNMPDRLAVELTDARPTDGGALWGRWFGREREYFLECARLVSQLRWADVLSVGGVMIAAHAEAVKDAYRQLRSDEMPARVRAVAVPILSVDDARVRIGTYSTSDPLIVVREVVDVLRFFDGRPVDEVISSIEERTSIVVEAPLVRRLLDFGVLEEAKDTWDRPVAQSAIAS